MADTETVPSAPPVETPTETVPAQTVETWDGTFPKHEFKEEDYEIPGAMRADASTSGADATAGPKNGEGQQESKTEPAQAEPTLDAALLARAKDAGLDAQELTEFGTDSAALERALNLIDRSALREIRRNREGQQKANGNGPPAQPQVQQQAATEPTAPPVQAPQPPVNLDFQFDPKLAETLDESAIGELKRLNEHHVRLRQGLIQEFNQALQQRDHAIQQLSGMASFMHDFVSEQAIDALGKDEAWKDVVANADNRAAIRQAAADLAEVRRQRGGGPLNVADYYALIRRGAMAEFGQDIKQHSVKQVREQARDEGGKFTSSVPPQARPGRPSGKTREDLFKMSRDIDRKFGLA